MTDPATSPASNLVAALYARAREASRPEPAVPAAAAPGGTEGFAGLAREFLSGLRASEDAARAGLSGRAEPQSVVMALAATEIAVETAVTLRNKVVEAYQEILRMPV
jgi:flagellar hook-basal body complex protein FliE